MLKNIPRVISPELLKTLAEMGHGDEIVIADGNFPGVAFNSKVIRADGIDVLSMLDAILSLMPLDRYHDAQAYLMEVVPGDDYKPEIWDVIKAAIRSHESDDVVIEHVERFAFYDRAKRAFAVIQTTEAALYANVILKKGVL